MRECTGKFYFEEGVLKESSSFDDYQLYAGTIIYEVLRVIESVPLFLEDHFDRLCESVRLNGLILNLPLEDVRKQIGDLCRANNISGGNIKIIIHYNESVVRSRIFFIEAKYPSDSMYYMGVDTILYNAERENPEAKVLNYSLRSTINQTLLKKDAYEALLVNCDNCITEGSRSNIFFVKNLKIYTAGDEFVLGGITRKYVKQLCIDSGIDIVFKCMPVNELVNVDSVFLTGTSPQLLPVRGIDSLGFNVANPLYSRLYQLYTDLVKSYIDDHH